MRRILSVAFVASTLFAGALFAAELKSGLQPGEPPPAYNVKDATGPNEGKSLCYRCKYGARPVVNIFARSMTPEVVALVKQIDGVVGKNEEKKMAAFVTLLTNDPDKDEAKLKIAENAELTVTMWVGSKVKVSHAFAKGEFKAANAKSVVEDTKKILD